MVILIVVGNLIVPLLGWLAIRIFSRKTIKFKVFLLFLKKNKTEMMTSSERNEVMHVFVKMTNQVKF